LTEYVTIVVHVPVAHTERVRLAMCDAGAGTVEDGHYDWVVFITPSTCRYRVLDKARNGAGAVGQEFEVQENRIEAICRKERIEAVVRAIVEAHPDETPAIAIYPTLTGEFKYWAD
jgi:hypothetical protein